MIEGIELQRPYIVYIATASAILYLALRVVWGRRAWRGLAWVENPLARWAQAGNKRRLGLAILEAASIWLILLSLASPAVKYKEVVEGVESSESTLEIPPRPGLILVLDVSGSMSGWKIEKVKESSKTLIESLDKRIDIGLIAFNDRIMAGIPPTSDRLKVLNATMRLEANGGTMYTYPLQLAYSWASIYRGYNLPVVTVFLSDGIPADRESIGPLIDKFRKSGIAIYTVYIGEDPRGYTLLKDMAVKTGGKAYYPKDARRLAETFNNIAMETNATLIKALAEARAQASVEVTRVKPLAHYMILSGAALSLLASLWRFRVSRLAF